MDSKALAPAPARTHTQFANLPLELREMIYETYFCLYEGRLVFQPRSANQVSQRSPINLLLTSRFIYADAIRSLIWTCKIYITSMKSLKYLVERHATRLRAIRTLVLDIWGWKRGDDLIVMLKAAASLPNLRTLCIFSPSGYPRIGDFPKLVAQEFSAHRIQPKGIFIINVELEASYARSLPLRKGCLKHTATYFGEEAAHEKMLVWIRGDSVSKYDQLTDLVRDALCEPRGEKRLCQSMEWLRKKLTVDALLGMKPEGRCIRRVMREL